MKVAIVGAAGLVGRHVSASVQAAGHDAVNVGRSLGGAPFDLRGDRKPLLAVLANVDVVVWAAARASVEACEIEAEDTHRVNVDVVRDVCADLDEGIGFIAFSSEYVFDGHKEVTGRAAGGAVGEDDPRRPLNNNGRQEVELEDIVCGRKRGAILRVSGVYGDEPARKNFVCQLEDQSRTGGRVVVADDQWITPTYAVDLGGVVVDTAVSVVEGSFAGVLHAAGPEVMRRLDFARLVVDKRRLNPETIEARPTAHLGLRAPRPLEVGLDTTLLRRRAKTVIRSARIALGLLTETPRSIS